MDETCKNMSKHNMWASLENASITIHRSPCVSTTINGNQFAKHHHGHRRQPIAEKREYLPTTSRIQNLVPTTIQSTTIHSSPTPKCEETQQDKPQPYRKSTQQNGFKSQNENAKNTPMCGQRWRSCCSRRRRHNAGSSQRRQARRWIYDGGSRD